MGIYGLELSERTELADEVGALAPSRGVVPTEERKNFLDSACGQDTELRRQVDLLLSAEENAGSFLDKAGAPDLTDTVDAARSLLGRQLGWAITASCLR